MIKKIDKFLVSKSSSIKDVMRAIDDNGSGVALVVDEKTREFFGLLTDGDIRRAILAGSDINQKVRDITNTNPITIEENFSKEDILEIKSSPAFKKKIIKGLLKVPVINSHRKVRGVLTIQVDGNNKLKLVKNENNNAVKKILVTGGAGYLGSVLCKKLLEKNYQVKVLDNLTYGENGIKDLEQNKNFEFYKGDIRNISDITAVVKGQDAVIHLAAIVGDPACKTDPEDTLEINYFATRNIVEICKYFQINRFIFASTCSVYGESEAPNSQLTEKSSLRPVSLYAQTKINCENLILKETDENFSPTILRMATLYGLSPLMRFDLALNLLSAKAVQEKEITIFGGEQWRPWLHLDDGARAYISVLEASITKIKGKIFNVLSENYKIIEVGKTIKSICPDSTLKIEENSRDKRNYNVSFEKISEVLGFKPEKKITDGILEIKNILENGEVKDYKNSKYRFSVF